MCLQCLTKARIIKRDILPGYTLMKATVGHKDWGLGWYGLVQRDDPDFVFPLRPLPDPSRGKNLDKDEKAYKSWMLWAKETDWMETFFKCDPETGYALYKACLRAGYRPKRDGFRLVYWLRDYMGRSLTNRGRGPYNKGITRRVS